MQSWLRESSARSRWIVSCDQHRPTLSTLMWQLGPGSNNRSRQSAHSTIDFPPAVCIHHTTGASMLLAAMGSRMPSRTRKGRAIPVC